MIPLPQLRGKMVAVLGLGPGGRALCQALRASDARVMGWDNRAEKRRRAGFGPERLAVSDWPFDALDLVVLADGRHTRYADQVIAAADAAGIEVVSELDLFGRTLEERADRPDFNVVAITGAAGKSVTCSIVQHVLRDEAMAVACGGDGNTALFSLPAPRPGMTYVLELSSARLAGATTVRADTSVILNVETDPGKGDVELTLRSILRLLKQQGPLDTAIIGVDDVYGQKLSTLLRNGRTDLSRMGMIIPVSGRNTLGHGIYAIDGDAYSVHLGKTRRIGDFSRARALAGMHFNLDAAAALAVCLSLDVPPEMIIKSLHDYRGLIGRFECLGSAGRISFVDDSYASSRTAVERAMRSCSSVYWIGDNRACDDTLEVETRGQYFLDAEKGPGALEHAFEHAFADASRSVATDPGSAPVILFAPGLPMPETGIDRNAFRSLALDRISQNERRA